MRTTCWLVALLASVPWPGAALGAPRPVAVGVVDYLSRYQWPKGERTAKAALRDLEARLAEIGVPAERVSPDLFLRQNWPDRDRYQRLVIPSGAEFFSQAIHEGMDDYVRSGGLLITGVSLILQDVDGDYVITDSDRVTTYPGETFLGVHGHQSARLTRVNVRTDCPLTRGLPVGEWLDLAGPLSGRNTRNLSAEVVMLSDRQMTDRPSAEQPFLTYKHVGRGACIYLVGQVGELADPAVRQVFRNLFAAETLEWLCLQE